MPDKSAGQFSENVTLDGVDIDVICESSEFDPDGFYIVDVFIWSNRWTENLGDNGLERIKALVKKQREPDYSDVIIRSGNVVKCK